MAALRLERLGGLWSGRSALELTISLTGVFLSIELERSTLLKQQINRYVMIWNAIIFDDNGYVTCCCVRGIWRCRWFYSWRISFPDVFDPRQRQPDSDLTPRDWRRAAAPECRPSPGCWPFQNLRGCFGATCSSIVSVSPPSDQLTRVLLVSQEGLKIIKKKQNYQAFLLLRLGRRRRERFAPRRIRR